jgi:exopolysaccharide biosynthesis polyprenyl glycosylphosphotransferase
VQHSEVTQQTLATPPPTAAARHGQAAVVPGEFELLLGGRPASAGPAPSLAWLLDGRGWMWLRPVLDAVALVVAVLVTLRWPSEPLALADAWTLLLLPPLAIGMLFARGTYARRLRTAVLDGVAPVAGAVSLAVMTITVGSVYLAADRLDPGPLAHVWALSVVLVGGGRIAAVSLQRLARSRGWVGRRALIVGAGTVGARVARRLHESPEYGLRPVGFLDADPLGIAPGPGLRVPVLGEPEDLAWIVERGDVEHVVLAFSHAPDAALVPLVQRCEELGLEVSIVPRLFESVNDRFSYDVVGGLPLLHLRQTDLRGWEIWLKHAFDRLLAAVLVFVLAPVLGAVALAVRGSSPGPVLFRQRRVGRDGKVFDLFKFRSMAPARSTGFVPPTGSAPGGVEGEDRRTRVGRLLRRTSLDELPQLFNVLRGEMSLVGPRPERPEFVELFAANVDRYEDRHRVKSGITGWAQVHGLRGQTSLTDRVEWDNYYIEHWSLALDLKVLAMTVVAVFRAAD